MDTSRVCEPQREPLKLLFLFLEKIYCSIVNLQCYSSLFHIGYYRILSRAPCAILSILYTVVCICLSHPPNLSLFHMVSPLITIRNLIKYDTKELIHETETDSQILKSNLKQRYSNVMNLGDLNGLSLFLLHKLH